MFLGKIENYFKAFLLAWSRLGHAPPHTCQKLTCDSCINSFAAPRNLTDIKSDVYNFTVINSHVLPLLMELRHSHQAHHWFKRYAFTPNSLEPFHQ